MIKKFTAWAIKTNDKENLGFIGRYWWFKENEYIPEKLEGCQNVLFKTREIARRNLQWVKSSYKKASIVHVCVTVDERRDK